MRRLVIMGKRVVYSCPFVPAEWIAAHGMRPSRIIPSSAQAMASVGIGAGVCPYARAFMNSAVSDAGADAIIATTLCDQMRRVSEVVGKDSGKPMFLMNVPHTWESANAQRMYASELERLGRFLVGLGGIQPSTARLTQTMVQYDAMRARIRDARSSMPSREYSELIAEFHRGGKVGVNGIHSGVLGLTGGCFGSGALQLDRSDGSDGSVGSDGSDEVSPLHFGLCYRSIGEGFVGEPQTRNTEHAIQPVYIPHGVPLALVGGPLLSDHFDIFDLIEGSGGYVALDATETGERTMPATFDRRRIADDPFGVLVDAYFGTIADAARRPNSMLYQWLKRTLSERGIYGIIFVRHIWCDTWHGEAQRMKEWLQLPFFDLDITEDASDTSRKLTRFQAFMEMLR